VVNRNGIRKIVELDLNKEEKEKFNHSVQVLKKTMEPIFKDF
jgi:L-lactate dehydrogenase